jgi:hypothetical protein
VVFSRALLHEARPVTRGRRYAFPAFLYDDEVAAIREEDARFLVTNDAAPLLVAAQVEADGAPFRVARGAISTVTSAAPPAGRSVAFPRRAAMPAAEATAPRARRAG